MSAILTNALNSLDEVMVCTVMEGNKEKRKGWGRQATVPVLFYGRVYGTGTEGKSRRAFKERVIAAINERLNQHDIRNVVTDSRV